MKFLTRLILDNLHRFVVGALLGGGLFVALVGTICYLLVREEAFWRLATLSTLVAIGAMLSAVVSGVRLAATQTLRGWVDAMGVGPMLSKVIFKQALGVSDKRPSGSSDLASELHGATLDQAKAKLATKLGELFHTGALDRWMPSQGRWLARKLVGGAGWAVTRSLLDRFDKTGPDDQSLDLIALRDRMATGLNEKAVSLVTARATAVAMAAVIGAGVVCVAVAALLGGV